MDRLDSIAAFVAVADHHGFAAAARALGASPPAVTRAVAALERHLGVSLFHRSTRAVSLTDEGAALLERARRVLLDWREAEQIASGGKSVPRGQLYVTAPVMFGRLHVLPVLSALVTRHEGLSARMILLDRNVRIVEEGIDVAVRIGPLADSALRTVRIGTVEQAIVASPAYLAERGMPAEPTGLAEHRCVVSSGGRSGNAWSFGPNGKLSVRVDPRLTVNTVDAMIAAAEAGQGLANLLSYQVADAIASGRLMRVLANHAPQPLPVSLLYDAGRAAMPAVRTFIEAMRDYARSQPWGRTGGGERP